MIFQNCENLGCPFAQDAAIRALQEKEVDLSAYRTAAAQDAVDAAQDAAIRALQEKEVDLSDRVSSLEHTSNRFIVNYTSDEMIAGMFAVTADKSAEDILSAFNNGFDVFASFSSSNIYGMVPLSLISNDTIIFHAAFLFNNSFMQLLIFTASNGSFGYLYVP